MQADISQMKIGRKKVLVLDVQRPCGTKQYQEVSVAKAQRLKGRLSGKRLGKSLDPDHAGPSRPLRWVQRHTL